jgi:hypothetical protein
MTQHAKHPRPIDGHNKQLDQAARALVRLDRQKRRSPFLERPRGCQMTSRKAPPTRILLTINDVARLDQCSTKTVRRAIDAGRLEVLRIGPDGTLIRIDPIAHLAYRQHVDG